MLLHLIFGLFPITILLFFTYESILFFQVLQNGDPNAYDIVLSSRHEQVLLDVQVLPSVPVFALTGSCMLQDAFQNQASCFCRIHLRSNLITKLSENHSTITRLVRTTLGHW